MHADENARPTVTIDALRNWSIVVSEDAAVCQHYAAEEFQRFYQQATGVVLPLKPSTTDQTGHVFIGPGKAMKESTLGRLMQKEYAEASKIDFVKHARELARLRDTAVTNGQLGPAVQAELH